jgi:hypothetical protein
MQIRSRPRRRSRPTPLASRVSQRALSSNGNGAALPTKTPKALQQKEADEIAQELGLDLLDEAEEEPRVRPFSMLDNGLWEWNMKWHVKLRPSIPLTLQCMHRLANNRPGRLVTKYSLAKIGLRCWGLGSATVAGALADLDYVGFIEIRSRGGIRGSRRYTATYYVPLLRDLDPKKIRRKLRMLAQKRHHDGAPTTSKIRVIGPSTTAKIRVIGPRLPQKFG